MLGALTTLLAFSAIEPGAPLQGSRPPNVILIMADDLGIGELGSYGQQRMATPRLDAFAEEGVRFTRFYSASTVCAPTRCSLLTGKHTGHASIRGNKEVGGWGLNQGEGQHPLPDEEVTLAEVLRQKGYATACVGKWGLGGPGSEGHPLRQGFDFFFGYLCQRQAHNYTPTHLWRNHDVFLLENNRYFGAHQRLSSPPETYDSFMGEQYAPELMLEQAEEFVTRSKDKPFFLYFASTIPHAALQAPKDWVERFPREWDPAPYLGQNGYLPSERPRATYAAMISYLDHSVGRLVDLVESLGLADDTLFIFKSDNGTAPNGGVDRQFFASLGELRGMKTNLYEGGIRVPFLARWKSRIRPARVENSMWATYDLFPTIAEICGASVPTGLDGISFAPTLLGLSQVKKHDFLYFEYPEGTQQQAVIRGDLKIVRPNLKNAPEAVELYDLSADPTESNDLAKQRPQAVRELLALAEREHLPSRDFPIQALDQGAQAKWLDLSQDRGRQVVVDREEGQYLGHVSTLLLEDQRTILATYPRGHGKGPIVLKKSTNGGLTWSGRLPVPENWATSLETPTVFRTIDPSGKKRLILWSGLYPARLSFSEDDGANWTPLKPAGDWGGIVVMGFVERLSDGRYLAMFHDDGRFFRAGGKAAGTFTLFKTLSSDGGLSWSFPEEVLSRSDVHLCEPGLVRSPDGKRMAVLLRENRRLKNSFVIVSEDEGASWSEPREVARELTGDRHTAKYAPDGRLVISFRDMASGSPTYGDWVAWVGRFEDIESGKPGQYRVRLMDNLQGADCAYPGVEVLPDGTFVCTTYGHWEAGKPPYIVSVRFKLTELDRLAMESAGR